MAISPTDVDQSHVNASVASAVDANVRRDRYVTVNRGCVMAMGWLVITRWRVANGTARSSMVVAVHLVARAGGVVDAVSPLGGFAVSLTLAKHDDHRKNKNHNPK
ncbi:MAG: hypothetical protein Q7S57_00205 [bacterium]|nr:hypothetical protein [bacterium]